MFSPYLLNSAKLDNFYFYNFFVGFVLCVFWFIFLCFVLSCFIVVVCGFFCNLYGVMTSYYIATTGSLNQAIVSHGNGKVRFQNEVRCNYLLYLPLVFSLNNCYLNRSCSEQRIVCFNWRVNAFFNIFECTMPKITKHIKINYVEDDL